MRITDLLQRTRTPRPLSRAAYKRLKEEVGSPHYLYMTPDGERVPGKPHTLEDLECAEAIKQLEAYEAANADGAGGTQYWAPPYTMKIVDLGVIDDGGDPIEVFVATTHDLSSWGPEDHERAERGYEYLRRVTGLAERHEAAGRAAEQAVEKPEPFFEAPQPDARPAYPLDGDGEEVEPAAMDFLRGRN